MYNPNTHQININLVNKSNIQYETNFVSIKITSNVYMPSFLDMN